jgi:endonuclease/exonuclease/phosphatase family metal-dependent hydrolase
MPTVLSWNVAGRIRSVPQQAAAIAQRQADVVGLQEIRAGALGAWQDALGELGFVHQHHSPVPDAGRGAAERRLGVLIASRTPITPMESPPIPWPERHAAAIVEGLGELHVLHSPISSKAGRVKVRTLETIAAWLAPPREHPVVLIGDLNTPAYESRDGEVRSFARTRTGNLRNGFDERHDLAELGIVVGLLEHGYVDCFRAVHGYLNRERSWMYPNNKMGYRLDHILARGLDVAACGYEHAWREARLSDHSAIWAELRAPMAPSPGDLTLAARPPGAR